MVGGSAVAILGAVLAFGVSACDGTRALPTSDAGSIPMDREATGAPSSALILDSSLIHVSTWVDVIQALEANNIHTRYRRFYPHITASDVRGEVSRSDLIVIAAGQAPDQPASLLRYGEIEWAAELVREGGMLVLAVESGLQDLRGGDNDWFVQNRILERVGAGIRIERNTLIADRWEGSSSPAHRDTSNGYPTALEPTFTYPYGRVTIESLELDDVALGRAPSLLVSGENAVPLVVTKGDVLAWTKLSGEENARYFERSADTPVAAIARVGEGVVLVLPRGLLTLSAVSGRLSDKPILRSEFEGRSLMFVRRLFDWIIGLRAGEETWPEGYARQDELFRVASLDEDALASDGEVIEVPVAIEQRRLPALPPAGELEEPLPVTGRPAELPEWWHRSGARVVWGSIPPDRTPLPTVFEDLRDYGLDAFVSETFPERLHGLGLSADEIEADLEMYDEVSELAVANDVPWIVGSRFVGSIYSENRNEFPSMVGAQGQLVAAPAPLYIPYWDRAIIPTCREVATLFETHPGMHGFLFDLELYGGPTYHVDGYAFSDATIVEASAAWPHASDLSELLTLPHHERLSWLVDRGELKYYFDTLSAIVRIQAQRCRDLVLEVDPEAWFFVYAPIFPSSWFYRGFVAGLSQPERPVIVMSYESWTGRVDEVMRGQDVNLVTVGGTDLSYYEPADFGEAIRSLTEGNSGYWYRSFNAISRAASVDPVHGAAAEYRDAMDVAHEAMDEDQSGD